MNIDKLFNLATSIVIVAGITTVLMRGSAAAQVFSSIGTSFSQAIKAAQGR